MKETVVGTAEVKSIFLDKKDVFMTSKTKELAAIIDVKEHYLPESLDYFDYPVSSWPVLIDSLTVARLAELSTKLPPLLYKISDLYFQDDVDEIAKFYFGGNTELAQFALMCHSKMVAIPCRLDLTYTNTGFKILEINTGSSIGGWQLDDFENIVSKFHPVLQGSDNGIYNYESIQQHFINFLIDKIIAYVKDIPSNQINIFIAVSNEIEQIGEVKAEESFNSLMQVELARRGLQGGVFMSMVKNLQLIEGQLYYNGNTISGVFMMDYGAETTTSELFRAHITEKVYFPDHLGALLLRDKRNLALLRDLASKNKFSAEENQMILEAIPWTVIMNDCDVHYKNVKIPLLDLVRNQRENFVLKIANGFKGDSVFVGKFCAENEWENAIQEALGENAFIVQEYSESIDFLAPNSTNNWLPHKLIWGSFGFGNSYGGVISRMTDVKIDDGVINSARGAVLGIVYECSE